MTRHTRLIATIALAIGSTASFIFAQGPPAQTPQTQAFMLDGKQHMLFTGAAGFVLN